MFFFSGINLIALGTISAYIGRIFDEVKQRPLYVIKQQIGSEQTSQYVAPTADILKKPL